MSWKDGLSKKIELEYDLSLLYYRQRWYFLFSKIWFYPQTENTRWSFSKKYTEIWYFLQMFWKDGLFKKDRAGIWSFWYYLERWYFPPRKHDNFSLDGKWEREMIFLKKYTETWYFLCTRVGVTNVTPRPPAKKNQRLSYPAKIHLKVIEFLDWHFRKSSSNSLYFHGYRYRCFHILLSSKKNQET